ncbi:thioesterase domain-containing protein [Shewanella gelidii]|uniref:Thioesterase n=1 Tax=Shewanella gelidii TaxID=1642821 RepID=A0A917JT69_9GAMM|nr:thioesterase domain-containing protein [Shewanella gelidii]MCL1098442.1 thioesterase domain-containing protein [Shewanella gelidii]GGI82709.1 thioesterase [Shewanella gelidii]
MQIAPLLEKLKQTWHQTIPVSEFMGVTPSRLVQQLNGDEFTVTAPLVPNVNLHQTMFAGSIYTIMTLTGWGMVWLQQALAQVDGDIVLADANIRYLKPVNADVEAQVIWPAGSWQETSSGHKKVLLRVSLFCKGELCAEFEGLYFSKRRI